MSGWASDRYRKDVIAGPEPRFTMTLTEYMGQLQKADEWARQHDAALLAAGWVLNAEAGVWTHPDRPWHLIEK